MSFSTLKLTIKIPLVLVSELTLFLPFVCPVMGMVSRLFYITLFLRQEAITVDYGQKA